MDDLIERIEALNGPDREVDSEIDAELGWSKLPNPTFAGGLIDMMVGPNGETKRRTQPQYTASLDAAMTLVPGGWDAIQGWDYPTRSIRKIHSDDSELTFKGKAATPALALCAAALRAREAQDG